MTITEILNQAIQKEYENEKRKKASISISKTEDIELFNFQDTHIDSVCINSSYNGPLPDLSSAVNIHNMSIFRVYPWQDILESIPPFAESLWIKVPAKSEPGKIVNPLLERLAIGFCATEESEIYANKMHIDFTNIQSLKYLELYNSTVVDLESLSTLSCLEYLKCTEVDDNCILLPYVPSLTVLHLRGSFENIIVPKEMPQLKKLIIEGENLSDLSFFAGLPGLVQLELYCPKLFDVSITDTLSGLKFIYCRYGNISNTGELLNRSSVKAVLTERDYALDYISNKTPYFDTFFLFRQLKAEEEYLLKHKTMFMPYSTGTDSGNKSLTIRREERFGDLLQKSFEREYYNKLNPFTYPYYRVYEASFKQYYIENAIKKYPFLKVTEAMRQQMLRESRPLSNWIKPFKTPGSILFVSNDILTISVKMAPGNGKFVINTTSGDKRADAEFKEEFFLRSKLLEDFDVKSYNYSISIIQYYSLDLDLISCILPILLAIQSLRDSIVLRSDTVLGVQFPNRYQDKRKQLRSDLSELKTGIV